MHIEFADEGFYIDMDKLDDDGLHPEVEIPEDINAEFRRLEALVKELEEDTDEQAAAMFAQNNALNTTDTPGWTKKESM